MPDFKIKVERLNLFYNDMQALKAISMNIQRNKVTSIIDPSGCGKSTFLRSLNRMNDIILDTRIEGTVLVDGKNIYALDVDVVEVRRKIGMVFQKSNPFPKSIFDNLAY